MSTMFKKPKRNFRGRRRDSGSDGENQQASGNALDAVDDENSSDVQMLEVKKSKKKKKEKDKTAKSTVLSFDHGEEEEGTFQGDYCNHSIQYNSDIDSM